MNFYFGMVGVRWNNIFVVIYLPFYHVSDSKLKYQILLFTYLSITWVIQNLNINENWESIFYVPD